MTCYVPKIHIMELQGRQSGYNIELNLRNTNAHVSIWPMIAIILIKQTAIGLVNPSNINNYYNAFWECSKV